MSGPAAVAQGALGQVTPEVTLAALRGVREGRVIDLSRVISGRAPRHASIRPPQRYLSSGVPVPSDGPSVTHDYMLLSTHMGTHIDALGHVGCDGAFFGGRGAEEVSLGGLATLGAEGYRAVVTRGVVLDLDVQEQIPVDVEALDAWQRSFGGLRPGDCLLLHGTPAAGERAERVLAVATAAWLAERGVAVVACDGLAIESGSLDLHVALLKERGIPLIEGLDLAELVAAGAGTCALSIGMVRSRGASAAWATVAAVL